jgi:single-strand DNA-binding protein
MAFSVNKVTLLGNIGKDIEFKTTPNGTALAKFSLATQESFKNKSDQWEERTEWHNIECWQKLAEFANKNFTKGSKIYLEGKIKTESYEKDGNTRYITKIIANEIVPCAGLNSNKSDDKKPQFNQAPVNKADKIVEAIEEKLSFTDVPF